jgi:hypothetical protein
VYAIPRVALAAARLPWAILSVAVGDGAYCFNILLNKILQEPYNQTAEASLTKSQLKEAWYCSGKDTYYG